MYKKIITALLSFAICVSVLCNCTAASVPKIYLALGDSISTGYGLDDSNFGFATIVSETSGLELATRAVNGSTAYDVYKQLEDGELDELIATAELITLTCGGNDMLDILYGQVADAYNASNSSPIDAEDVADILADTEDSRRMILALRAFSILAGNDERPPFSKTDFFMQGVAQYEENLKKIIGYIRERNTAAQVVVATQYNPYRSFENSDFGLLYTSIDDCLSVLNSVIVSGANRMNYKVADVYTAFQNSDSNLCNSDAETMNLDFHPNGAGHRVIAECIADVVAVSDNSLPDGVAQGKFAPRMPISRAMLINVLQAEELLLRIMQQGQR